MNRVKNLLISLFLFCFGIYFAVLCIGKINELGWNIVTPSEQVRTPRHPDGEDLSQFILSILCGLGGIFGGISYLYFALSRHYNSSNQEQIEDNK